MGVGGCEEEEEEEEGQHGRPRMQGIRVDSDRWQGCQMIFGRLGQFQEFIRPFDPGLCPKKASKSLIMPLKKGLLLLLLLHF